MRFCRRTLLLGTVLLAACGSHPQEQLTAAYATEIEQSVRAFATLVAHDVSQEGPAAWRRHFADIPAFFMAVDGHVEYASSAAASAGIQDLTRSIKRIELRWGDDLRVDSVTPHLAMLGTSWHEIIESVNGGRVDAGGYFTGLVERREGRWQFRDAHWSVTHPGVATH
jgi:hypothetical protein